MYMYNNYVTKDLYLSAYLIIKGQKFKINKVEKTINFEFIMTDEIMYYVNDYLMGNGSCEPLLFTNAIKNIKNLIHHNSL